MTFANLAEQVNPNLVYAEQPLLIDPQDGFMPLLTTYNSFQQIADSQQNKLFKLRDFQLARKVHIPDPDIFSSILEYYTDVLFNLNSKLDQKVTSYLTDPHTLLYYCDGDESVKSAILRSAYKLQEAFSELREPNLQYIQPAIHSELSLQVLRAFDLITTQQNVATLKNLYTSYTQHWSWAPEWEAISANRMALLYLTHRVTAAMNIISTALYEDNQVFLDELFVDVPKFLTTLITLIDPGISKGIPTSYAAMITSLLHAKLTLAQALIARDRYDNFNDSYGSFCRGYSDVFRFIDIDLSRYSSLESRHIGDGRNLAHRAHKILEVHHNSARVLTRTPVALSLLPVVGERMDNYLKMKDNMLLKGISDSLQGTYNKLIPTLPLTQPGVGFPGDNTKSSFVLPSVLGVKENAVRTFIVTRKQTATDKLPELCLTLVIEDSHRVEIPFFLGISAYTLPCMLVPYSQVTLDYLRSIYDIPGNDPLASYGSITRYLIHSGTTEFSRYIGTGELCIYIADEAPNTYRLSSPNLVDIGTFMGESQSDEPQEVNMFWEIRMRHTGSNEGAQHIHFLNTLFNLNQNQ